jgi:hypothetical protein
MNPHLVAILNVLDFNAGIAAVQMLGNANFVALVGGGKQPKFSQNKVSTGRNSTMSAY